MVQFSAHSHAFDGFYFCTANFRAENQARANYFSIKQHRARAAITCATAFLGSGQTQLIAKHVEQSVMFSTGKFHRITVDSGLNMYSH